MAAPPRFGTALIVLVTLLAAFALMRGRFTSAPATPVVAPSVPSVPAWQALTESQRKALAPLQKEWNGMADERRQKWLGVAARYAALTPQEQTRMQTRMRKWTELSPAERDKARNQYRKLRTVQSSQRRELEQLWQEYAALSGEEKDRLKASPVRVGQPASRQAPVRRSSTAPMVNLPNVIVMAPPGSRPPPRPVEAVSAPASAPVAIPTEGVESFTLPDVLPQAVVPTE